MKIYFSEATADDIDTFGDEGTFVTEDRFGTDRYFYNGVEHGTNSGGIDEVRIFDGCNRSIPIAVDSIPDLIAALNECLTNYNTLKEAEAIEQSINSPLVLYVEDNCVEISE